ncbi:uncharacterized protein LOC134264090 [Saccostrea cucullata]|uniref:uncharacterized protein LOC134264090 n=1 Tax=Saccostrea cuccullata TaxID=36930 RepID=UPI002ED03ED1
MLAALHRSILEGIKRQEKRSQNWGDDEEVYTLIEEVKSRSEVFFSINLTRLLFGLMRGSGAKRRLREKEWQMIADKLN